MGEGGFDPVDAYGGYSAVREFHFQQFPAERLFWRIGRKDEISSPLLGFLVDLRFNFTDQVFAVIPKPGGQSFFRFLLGRSTQCSLQTTFEGFSDHFVTTRISGE